MYNTLRFGHKVYIIAKQLYFNNYTSYISKVNQLYKLFSFNHIVAWFLKLDRLVLSSNVSYFLPLKLLKRKKKLWRAAKYIFTARNVCMFYLCGFDMHLKQLCQYPPHTWSPFFCFQSWPSIVYTSRQDI